MSNTQTKIRIVLIVRKIPTPIGIIARSRRSFTGRSSGVIVTGTTGSRRISGSEVGSLRIDDTEVETIDSDEGWTA